MKFDAISGDFFFLSFFLGENTIGGGLNIKGNDG